MLGIVVFQLLRIRQLLLRLLLLGAANRRATIDTDFLFNDSDHLAWLFPLPNSCFSSSFTTTSVVCKLRLNGRLLQVFGRVDWGLFWGVLLSWSWCLYCRLRSGTTMMIMCVVYCCWIIRQSCHRGLIWWWWSSSSNLMLRIIWCHTSLLFRLLSRGGCCYDGNRRWLLMNNNSTIY